MSKMIPLTELELNVLYGQRQKPINYAVAHDCEFTDKTHYYLQRENDVLHVCDDIINVLHVGFFNQKARKFREIETNEFNNKIKEAIYKMELEKYWG